MKNKILIASLTAATLSAQIGLGDSETTHAGFYKKLDNNTYLLNLLPGAKLVESLKAFQKATGVPSASVSGLGVLKNVRLGQYRFIGEPLTDGSVATPPRFPTHDDVVIKGHREIVSLVCNLTTQLVNEKGTSKTDPHCHIALAGSDDASFNHQGGYNVVGGHLVEGEVAVIAELFIATYPTAVNKKDGGELGGTIIHLDESQGGTALNY